MFWLPTAVTEHFGQLNFGNHATNVLHHNLICIKIALLGLNRPLSRHMFAIL